MLEDNFEPKKKELMEARATFVARFINTNAKKGIKITHSVKQLAYHILFVTEKTIYTDLKKGRK